MNITYGNGIAFNAAEEIFRKSNAESQARQQQSQQHAGLASLVSGGCLGSAQYPGNQPQPREENEIPERLNRIGLNLDLFEVLAGRLEIKFSSVLSPPNSAAADGLKGEPDFTPLGGQLREVLARLQAVERRLEDLLARAQL